MDISDKYAVLALKDKIPANIGELRPLLGFFWIFFQKICSRFFNESKTSVLPSEDR